MKKINALSIFALTALLGSNLCRTANAQHLLLDAPITQGSIGTPITFNIVVDGNVGSAVSWGTTASLSDPLKMSYNPAYANQTLYNNSQPFFDTDLTDTSAATSNGTIKFNFLNTTPGANFVSSGYNGYAVMAEFQVLFGANTPVNTQFAVNLSALGIPPDGTAVQDDQGNNLLVPTNPNNPTASSSIAYLYIKAGLKGNFWQLGSVPTAVPEPGVLSLVFCLSGGAFLIRCRRRA